MEEPIRGLSISYQHAFYIESMLFNTTSALRSLNVVIKILEKNQNNEIEIQEYKDRFLNELHNIVNQSGAISRYFWPASASPRKANDSQKNIHKIRGTYLRNIFDIEEGSPLENRALEMQLNILTKD